MQRRRSLRRRTKWLGVEPSSLTFSANDSYQALQLVLEDSSGDAATQDLVGGTIVRVLVDTHQLPSLVTTGADESGSWILHLALAMIPSPTGSTPPQAQWSPNTGFGNFMSKQVSSGWIRAESIGWAVSMDHNGRTVSFDTEVSRRVHEGDRLWLLAHYFETGIVDSVSIGITGRVLFMLP